MAKIEGQDYKAYTYGAGLEYLTRKSVPLNGIAVPNGSGEKLLALDPMPAQRLEVDQIAAIKTAIATETICEVSQAPSTSRNEETAFSLGGQAHFFCGVNHASAYLAKKTAELGLNRATKSVAGADVAYSSYTEGRKRMLLCRVDFPDYVGEVMSTNSALTTFNTFSNNMAELSYGRLLFARLGQGSYITPTMRITATAASLAGDLGGLLAACQTACTAIGIDWNQFDFHFVCTSAKPTASFAGVGFVGGDGFWLANSYWGAGTATHEYGHNLGLNHANFWDTSGNSIIGSGTSIEYGDSFDPMGAAGASPQHYNSRYKNYLGWITNADCPTITASGTYRVYAHDVAGSATAGVRGLRIVRDANQNYWVDLRQRFNTKSELNGVNLHWTGNGNQSSLLLDTTPGSANGINDSTLVIGRTFDDPVLGLHVTPIGKGNTYPESMDVVINLGNPANQAPSAIVSASTTAPGVSQSVMFTASATDANGDTLAYSWDFGDGDFSVDNKAVTSHSFAAAGDYLVQCTVSDMKGGSVRDSVLVRAGSPSTFRIGGRVLLRSQQPLPGVRVSVDATHYAFTDSDGTYTITGLNAGGYTVSAILNGYSFTGPFFNNPVTVGPNFAGADFIATVGSANIYTPIVSRGSTWKYLDNGTDQGTTWTGTGFNDSTWGTGPAVLGYGQGNEATTLSYGADPNNKYITYYFRQAFSMSNPAAFTNALLEVLRDDGVIVYLNGTEIFRDNMPAGPVTASTFAIASVEPSGYLQTNVNRSLLIAGNNIITAEIHQSDRTSSDVNFDLALSGLSVTNASGLQLVYVASPQNDQVFTSPSSIAINAVAESGGAPVTLVEFYGDGSKIGQSTASPFAMSWSSPTLADHVLNVVATLGNGIQLTSAPVRITVQSPTAPPVVSTLLAQGSTWKFFASNSAPTGAWTTRSYNDSNWRSGAAELGYGDGGEATILPFGPDANNKWVTAYFRRAFTMNDPGGVTNLILNLKRDDGAVVYLNGVEVLRDYMAPGPVVWGTFATNSAPDDGQIFISFPLNPIALTQGTNLLAVEIHQSAGNSSDLSFDAGLVATATPTRAPQISLLSPTNGAAVGLPSDVLLSADAVAAGGLIITQLQFFADDLLVAGDNSYPFSASWSNAPVGSHQLFAVATDSAGGSITSAPVSITVSAPAKPTQLISFGDPWKYLDDGSNQGTNWSKRVFDDRTWMSGPAQFGYGGHGETTTLNYGTNLNVRYITAYFRKAFNLGLPTAYSGFLLRMIRDDGVVVYVNGVEAYRNNLPQSQVSWNSLASTSLNAPEESTP
ncbi:MAG TPA: Ig-like domain-containing protein, partial [Candidatus Saccharimonadales bacterium]|nr:Ig-like domain-containing protein [Candidatus Saccharimonadales bacterium]